MKWKSALGLAVLLAALAIMTGCSTDRHESAHQADTKLVVFAAASMTESMRQIAEAYQKEHPNVEIIYNFDSSGTLKQQIQNGAVCDVFISAAQKPMNELDASKDEAENPEQLDVVLQGTRVDLLANTVVLAVPEGNPSHIAGFDDMMAKLKNRSIRIAMGNRDVPVGQYAENILSYYGVDEQQAAAQGCITYGSNVKEVTTQIREGSADCGIIYSTDAHSAGLQYVDEAAETMCGQVVYPAAVMKTSANQEEARAFLAYLQGDQAMAVFEDTGFRKAG